METNKIYNKDCLMAMKKMPSNIIDNVITSPPYNTMRHAIDQGYDEYKDGITNENYSKWVCEIFNEFDRILKNNGSVIWNMSYGGENTECMSLTVADIIRNTPFTLADIIVWKKQNATPNNVSQNKITRICEYVYIFCRKSEFYTFETNKKVISTSQSNQKIYENIFNYIEAPNNDYSTPLNKATFSTDFVKKLIKIYVKPHSLVLDTFMGTGTTAIGCIDSNVNFIGFETSKKQCEHAEKRIADRIRQCSMFDEIDYNTHKKLGE